MLFVFLLLVLPLALPSQQVLVLELVLELVLVPAAQPVQAAELFVVLLVDFLLLLPPLLRMLRH
jgi:hypothetical protein